MANVSPRREAMEVVRKRIDGLGLATSAFRIECRKRESGHGWEVVAVSPSNGAVLSDSRGEIRQFYRPILGER